jgi:basic membrane lipoprotein Med (substrate-binding protein (PBP1-ABC) superfamily)
VGHKVWFIDVIGNKGPIDKNHVLLSSVLWNFTSVFQQAVNDINNGTFGTHDYFLSAKNGIKMLKTRNIRQRDWNLILHDQAAIAAGQIHIPLTTTEAQVKALMHK